LLGRNFEAYLASVHHAQNIASFLDKGPTAQLDLLSELLDLEVYERAADVASDWAKKEQKAIGDINVNVAGKRGQLFTLEQQEDKLEVREMTYLRKRVRFLLECDNQIAGWRKQLQIDQRKLDDVNYKIENVDEKEVKEEKRISEEAAHTLARVSAESHLLRTRRAQLVTALRETYRCPTCGRLFEDSERAVNHAEKELNRVDSELKELDEKIRELRARNEQATKRFLNLSKEINDELEGLHQYRKTHETAITTARTNIEQLQKQRRDFQSGDNPFTADTADVADEINCIRNAIERKMFALDSAIGREASLAFWSKGFKDLRLSVVEMALAHLTMEVNNKLDQLGLPNWRLAVEAEGITKTGNIRRGMRIAVLIDGIERPMGRVSQGSRQRLRIAVMLGIADMIEYATGGRFNIELFDEPTAWLSKSGVTALLTVLQDRARLRNRRIYLADHRSYAFPVDDRLTVVRRRDGATIERD
jgi:DNA repair exonuclease SbcCD ATPase subunit